MRTRVPTLILSAAALLVAPTSTIAQDGSIPSDPDSVEWSLVTYLADDVVELVTQDRPVTLFLEAGAATGSAGCNDFATTYERDGSGLTFAPPSVDGPAADCDAGVQELEATYLTSLERVTGFEVFGRTLDLSDADGSILLTFVRSALDVRADELLALATTLGAVQLEVRALREELGDLRVGGLRERIGEVERRITSVQEQVDGQRFRDLRTQLGGIELTLAESIERSIELRRRVRNLESRLDALAESGAPASPEPAIDLSDGGTS